MQKNIFKKSLKPRFMCNITFKNNDETKTVINTAQNIR